MSNLDTHGISISFGIDLTFVELICQLIPIQGIENFVCIHSTLKYKYGYDMNANECLVFGYVLGLYRSQQEIDEIFNELQKPRLN